MCYATVPTQPAFPATPTSNLIRLKLLLPPPRVPAPLASTLLITLACSVPTIVKSAMTAIPAYSAIQDILKTMALVSISNMLKALLGSSMSPKKISNPAVLPLPLVLDSVCCP